MTTSPQALRALEWIDAGALRIIDQRELPGRLSRVDLASADDVIDAIRTLAVRGANSIGSAGAFGFALGVRDGEEPRAVAARVAAARPTAVALREGVAQAAAAVSEGGSWRDAVRVGTALLEQDVEDCARIGEAGRIELAGATSILTHCNTGILATAGIGTALGVVYAKAAAGEDVHVYSTETRPLRQGLRLTVWELQQAEIPVTALVDSAAAALLHSGAVDAVVVGADRIAANGDTANKVGTFSVALAARDAGVPFYVAAPLSAVDVTAADGGAIPIELRGAEEVLREDPGSAPLAAADTDVWNPSFDVTPARLIDGIITERGVAHPDLGLGLAALARPA
ncbi:MAG: S-methyl-5-thioribose-1-phosphate isomerase [Actinomyces sp.]|jgi:methylthioribose-1-phosphate isomerase|nr:S-methyl-5-thioribose-1-phosphate isomerase [Actinomyces sp.]MCI1642514.1 S-methyl-5-thioribose-1-phosphate isomerase [Actinomyces sp.]MCI1663053.1 S-methyl-5-thioribose-1-phosphate isomerase [Actinomyces sp.]MCI1691691.1 S-methyl-5-thioribose-1-phosphate isomerase [Actinomyces sp.]MCI1788642.1 S-methyl-5-thioribose-1-phosphate isomerase [Actinomyces sp.]MCI1829744.1 S-methyl-5-thioribose-1-phosphate isomerase [Actinomyces sp.]